MRIGTLIRAVLRALFNSFLLFCIVAFSFLLLLSIATCPTTGDIIFALMPMEKKVNVALDHRSSCGTWPQDPFAHIGTPNRLSMLGNNAIPYLLNRLGDTDEVPMAEIKGGIAAQALWLMGDSGQEAMFAYAMASDDPDALRFVALAIVFNDAQAFSKALTELRIRVKKPRTETIVEAEKSEALWHAIHELANKVQIAKLKMLISMLAENPAKAAKQTKTEQGDR